MIHVHRLDGCAPAPLAHYLKALGVLRLVAEQADPQARGWWEGDRYRLATKLSRKELQAFFLNDYRPTPFIAPWNKGSGFFFEKDPGLFPLEHSKGERFEEFRSAIKAGRSRLEQLREADAQVRQIKKEATDRSMSKAEKAQIRNSEDYKNRLRDAEKNFKQIKAELIPGFRLIWRGASREWMDAAMVLGDGGDPKYPALLGSGGNDGRLDFTNNLMKRLGEAFHLDSESGEPSPEAFAWISGALWGVPVPGSLTKQPVGQYLPGTAGGANNGNGPNGEAIANPLDFILLLEGAVAFRSGTSRRLGLSESSRAASPFAVNACGAAYVSASVDDEGARGEQWMPLWHRPSSYAEVRRLLSEGRAQIGAKSAREPLDVAQAVKRMGAARGIRAFERYGYIERNGQSNLAVPLGRFEVADGHSSLTCIDDLSRWLQRLRREARSKNSPARLVAAEKRLVEALFAIVKFPQNPIVWQQTLIRLAEIEGIMAHDDNFDARFDPVPALRPEWVTASDDGTPEFRLALAFALQASDFRMKGGADDGIRRHWLPLDQKQQAGVVMHGRSGLDDAIALITRRLLEAAQGGGRHLPLKAAPRAAARAADLTGLLSGGVNLDHTLAIGRALMALDHRAWAERHLPMESPSADDWPDDAWLAVRLAALPWPLRMRSGFELDVGAEPAVVRRLAAGDAASALTIALRRLAAAGVRSTVRACTTTTHTAKLWAAALAFPITQRTAGQFLQRLDPSKRSNHDY